jgi:hypothetical protein
MNESVTRARAQPADDDSQARRTERGVVAGYIHELSRRHDAHRTTGSGVEAAADASEGS